MTLRSLFALLALCAPVLVPSHTSAAPAAFPVGDGEHVDTRLGIKFFVPKSWAQIPLTAEERWMVAKYLSDKSYFHTEKGGGWTSEHKPDLQVIAFVSEAMKTKIKAEKKETESGVELRIFIDNPYKDYEDYLKRRYSGGGWFVSDKKESKVGDVAVTQYEIKVEKLSQDGPKRIFTWIYHVPDVDVAVQYEVLESAIDKLKNEISRTHKSFKSIPRKGGPLHEVSTGEDWMFVDQDKLTPEERKARRQGLETRAHEKVAKTAPEGWKVQKMGRFLVMNHADEKFARTVVAQCEAVWNWLDKTFPFVGTGEYVRSPVIRICANQDEYNSFYKGADWFSVNELEITTYQDFGGKTSYNMQGVNREVKDIWFLDRDRDLALAMPGWLSIGIDHFVGHIQVAKNGQAEFGTDYSVKDGVRERMREGKLAPPRELMVKADRDFTDWGQREESAFLLGYFVTGPASKDRRTKTVLSEYMRNLKDVALELKKEKNGGGDDAPARPKTEEEEDAWFKEQKQSFKAGEQRLLQETFQRTFLGWADDDWKKFQEAYEKTIQ